MRRGNASANRILFSLSFFLLACGLPCRSPAHMAGLSTEALVRASETVVEGDVEEVVSRWSGDGKTIVTRGTVAVRRVIRGDAVEKQVVVEYEGGEVGRVGLKVSDAAEMKRGEKVILFLKRGKGGNGGAVFHTVGKAQGRYVVGDDGIARKRGFSLGRGGEAIDNDLPVDALIEKIKRVR